MAVIDEFEVRIRVNEEYATEYNDHEEPDEYQPSTITKYVEAISGASFAIEFTVAKEYDLEDADVICFYLYLDGTYSNGRVLNGHKFGHQIVLAGCHEGQGANQKFLQYHFADLDTRELEGDDDIASFKQKYEELGIIQVAAWRETDKGPKPYNGKGGTEVGTVPEKALKGRRLDVTTSLKEAPNTKPSTFYQSTMKLDTEPVARFMFEYRTREALQAELIIFRSPSPVPLEKRDINTLTREELQQLVERQREQIEIKHERGIKRERTVTLSERSRPYKTSRLDDKEIVHLDSDDEEPKPDAQQSLPVEEVIETVDLS